MLLVVVLRWILAREVRLIGLHSVAWCLALSALALATRASSDRADMMPLSWWAIWLVSVMGAFVFTGIAATIDARGLRSHASLAFLAAIGGLYFYGGTILANALLDHSPADVHRVAIIGKHMPSTRGETYNVNLMPWGPLDHIARAPVSRAAFDVLEPAGVACVHVRGGALHIAWFRVLPC